MANDRPWHIALSPDPFDEPVVEQRNRAREPLRGREWVAATAVGGGALALALGLFLTAESQRTPAVWVVLLLVGSITLLSRLEFEIGGGTVVPTQLAFVPMLFLVPLGWVPLLVVAAMFVGGLMDVAFGRLHGQRVVVRLADAWFSVGPVLVLSAFGERGVTVSDLPIYAVAFGGQLATEFLGFTVKDWIVERTSVISQLLYTARSAPIDAALAPIGLALAFPSQTEPLMVLLGLPLVLLLSAFSHERSQRINHALELGEAYRGTARLLGEVVEADDAYTGFHSRDVVRLSVLVAEELGLDRRQRADVELTALLHDVGKIRVPAGIINKPGALTADELEVMRAHTIEGQEMLEQVGGLLGRIGALVRSCHERWDGDGYPDRLAREKIPLVSRIVMCCDAYSAMTTDRPYRAALPLRRAMAELIGNGGSQFDPSVARALVDVLMRQEEDIVAMFDLENTAVSSGSLGRS